MLYLIIFNLIHLSFSSEIHISQLKNVNDGLIVELYQDMIKVDMIDKGRSKKKILIEGW